MSMIMGPPLTGHPQPEGHDEGEKPNSGSNFGRKVEIVSNLNIKSSSKISAKQKSYKSDNSAKTKNSFQKLFVPGQESSAYRSIAEAKITAEKKSNPTPAVELENTTKKLNPVIFKSSMAALKARGADIENYEVFTVTVFSNNKRCREEVPIKWNRMRLLGVDQQSIENQLNEFLADLTANDGKERMVAKGSAEIILHKIKSRYPNIRELTININITTLAGKSSSKQPIPVTIRSESNKPILDLTIDQIKEQLKLRLQENEIKVTSDSKLKPLAEEFFKAIREETAMAYERQLAKRDWKQGQQHLDRLLETQL